MQCFVRPSQQTALMLMNEHLPEHKKSRGPAKRKTFVDYSKRHQLEFESKLSQTVKLHFHFLGFIILYPSKLKYSMSTLKSIRLSHWLIRITLKIHLETLTDEEIDDINFLLYAKERFNISNDAYHELSMTCKELLRSWKVQERIKAFNCKWNLSSTTIDTCGIQQSIKEQLEIRLQTPIKYSPSNSAFQRKS